MLRLLRNNRGAAAVEFALISLPVIIFLFGIIQTAWGGSMLAMDATTLEIKSHFFLPTNSVDLDIEWGSSPTLFETSDGLRLVAATGKDGILYAQRRDKRVTIPTMRIPMAV